MFPRLLSNYQQQISDYLFKTVNYTDNLLATNPHILTGILTYTHRHTQILVLLYL